MENQVVTPDKDRFRVQIGGPDLKFREVIIKDPKPTGRQLIEAFGGNPPDDFDVLQWIGIGNLRVIGDDETVDLKGSGEEKFTVAHTDRLFDFEIDGHKTQWVEALITRDVLLAIAGQDPKKFSAWQEFRNQPDKEIVHGEPANLDPKGTERFYTVVTHTTEGSP